MSDRFSAINHKARGPGGYIEELNTMNDELQRTRQEIEGARQGQASIDERIDGIDTSIQSINTLLDAAKGTEPTLPARLEVIEIGVSNINTLLVAAKGDSDSISDRFEGVDSRLDSLENSDANERFTSQVDTPSEILANGFLRGNSAGEELIFTDASPDSGIPDAPLNTNVYGRQNGLYVNLADFFLSKAQNLSDLSDKGEARENIGVHAKADVYEKSETYSRDEIDSRSNVPTQAQIMAYF